MFLRYAASGRERLTLVTRFQFSKKKMSFQRARFLKVQIVQITMIRLQKIFVVEILHRAISMILDCITHAVGERLRLLHNSLHLFNHA